MKSAPLVTVMTSCYNHEKYLDDYFRGLLAQTYDNVELILFDDGSTDRSWEKILSYEVKIKEKFSRVVIERHANMGAAHEHQTALNLASGEYLCWLDSDDYYLPAKIEASVDYLEAHREVGVVHSDFDVVSEKGIEERHWLTKGKTIPRKDCVLNHLLSGEFCVLPVAACFRTRLVRRCVNFPAYREKGYLMGDLPMFLDLARQTPFGYIEDSLARYRSMSGSASRPKEAEKMIRFHESLYRVRSEYAEKFGVSENVKRNIDKANYRRLYNVGYEHCFSKKCLEGYAWLAEHFPEEYDNRWHRVRARSTRSRLLWELVKASEGWRWMYRVRTLLGRSQ